jgi:glycosyltransferase involved in cell wall biosynthesis
LECTFDILFIDDNSPDGTADILKNLARKDNRVSLIVRSGKSGVGSAHKAGIMWAYDRGYDRLVTLDCDLTHAPEDISIFLKNMDETDADVVVGSRFLREKSLDTWGWHRKLLTRLGHISTQFLLGLPFDATGAFRVYNLRKIPSEVLIAGKSDSYEFFYESLTSLHRLGFLISEVPINLNKRNFGSSKMRPKDLVNGVLGLFILSFSLYFKRGSTKASNQNNDIRLRDDLVDPQNWDAYWSKKKRGVLVVYDCLAFVYRIAFIRPALNHHVRKHFSNNSTLLHAGCGGGQVDRSISQDMNITALDISPEALKAYHRINPWVVNLMHGSILDIPVDDGSVDGVYNLGVMEHFTEEEIHKILIEFNRVTTSNGKILLFWPPTYGLSVLVLDTAHFILNILLKKNIQLHPPELTRARNRKQINQYLKCAHFELIEYNFGIRDFFTCVTVVARKVQKL